MFTACDVIIRGSGMAGASLAAKLAPHRKVVLEEIEDQPGRHATGRSAAMFFESYSNHHARHGACQPGLSRTPTGRVCCRAIALAAQRALRLRRPASGGVASGRSDLGLLRDLEGIVDLDAEVPHRGFQLGVSEEQLNRA